MIKLRQLHHARALARYGNFHRAAQAENISQPAFSRSIRNLEDTLGVPLFERLTDGVIPTLFGESLLRRSETIFVETEELEREIHLLKGRDLGHFSVAMGVYPSEISASCVVGELSRRHPNLQIRTWSTSWKYVAELVQSHTADLGIAEISPFRENSDLETELIAKHEVVLFCRQDHPLLSQTAITKSDLDRYPLALVRVPMRMAGRFPGKGHIDEKSGDFVPAIEVDDLVTARNIVLHSDAFGAMTPLQIEPWLRSGEFRILPFHAPWLRLEYGFIYLHGRLLSPAASLYMQLVREYEAENIRRNHELIEQWFPG